MALYYRAMPYCPLVQLDLDLYTVLIIFKIVKYDSSRPSTLTWKYKTPRLYLGTAWRSRG